MISSILDKVKEINFETYGRGKMLGNNLIKLIA